MKALLQSVSDQPDADAVLSRFDQILDAPADKLPAVAQHLDAAGPTSSPSPRPQGGLAPDLVLAYCKGNDRDRRLSISHQ